LSYFDRAGRDDVLTGGVRMIPITTQRGEFKVWTKRGGNNPSAKLLLLHGGPAATHEYFEAADSYLPGAGIEYYYYDQLGSAYSARARRREFLPLGALVGRPARNGVRTRAPAVFERARHLQHDVERARVQ
jgi:proline iminopeptidase